MTATPASASECLIDIDEDGTATARLNTNGGATSADTADSLSCGVNAAPTGTNSPAVGNYATANSLNSTAIGNNSIANGNNSIGVGNLAQTKGNGEIAMGNLARATGTNSVAIGNGATATNAGQMVIAGLGTNTTSQVGTVFAVTTDKTGALGLATSATAQQQTQLVQPQIQPPPSNRPVPDALEMSKLVWSTIIAVDHANRSGNYSVLRDMSAQGFQINNTAATLASTFAGIRNSRINLSNVLLVPPTYSEAPRQIQADVFEVKGVFVLRPTSIFFYMYFQWEHGQWKLFGIDIQTLSMQSGAAEPPQQANRAPKR